MTLLALAAPVGACVTRGGEEPSPTPPSGYNFAYQASQREAIGLIQAFDDGAHTYLQFRDHSSYLTIRVNANLNLTPFLEYRQSKSDPLRPLLGHQADAAFFAV